MSRPERYTLTPTVRGDTWKGLGVTVKINGTHPAVALASARMQWRYGSAAGEVGHTVSTADSTILIDDAATWSMRIPAQVLPLGEGIWIWDLELTDAEGTIRTPLEGTHRILRDVTR